MTIKLTKDSIDLGIVTTNPEAMTAFYRDVLGFEDGGQMSLPGGSMIRLLCGSSVIKLVTTEPISSSGRTKSTDRVSSAARASR